MCGVSISSAFNRKQCAVDTWRAILAYLNAASSSKERPKLVPNHILIQRAFNSDRVARGQCWVGEYLAFVYYRGDNGAAIMEHFKSITDR